MKKLTKIITINMILFIVIIAIGIAMFFIKEQSDYKLFIGILLFFLLANLSIILVRYLGNIENSRSFRNNLVLAVVISIVWEIFVYKIITNLFDRESTRMPLAYSLSTLIQIIVFLMLFMRSNRIISRRWQISYKESAFLFLAIMMAINIITSSIITIEPFIKKSWVLINISSLIIILKWEAIINIYLNLFFFIKKRKRIS